MREKGRRARMNKSVCFIILMIEGDLNEKKVIKRERRVFDRSFCELKAWLDKGEGAMVNR
jgi:hypothetical protein